MAIRTVVAFNGQKKAVERLVSYSLTNVLHKTVFLSIIINTIYQNQDTFPYLGMSSIYFRYENNLEDAKNFGIKKAITTNVSMGFTQFVIFGTYALAFWYGTKLSVDEPENYTIGKTITVSFYGRF